MRISERLAESTAGAVFSGVDLRTGEHVVVKFSRRGIRTSAAESADAETLRRHDHALRSEIDGAFDCPRALALQELPEGVVTVENKIEGVPLAVLIERRNLLYHGYGSGPSNPVAYARLVCRTMVSLLEVLTRMHESGIVHGDITPANILLKTEGNGPVRPVLIDFELAVGKAGERPAHGRTPGYAPKWTPRDRQAMVASDLFAFGRVVLASFAMVQNLGEIDVEAMVRVFRGVADLFEIPERAVDAIAELLRTDEPGEEDRATWFATLRALLDHLSGERQNRSARRPDVVMPSHEAVAAQIIRSADGSSPDRLFPGPLAYAGPGASLGHGSAGVLWVLAQCGAEIPPEWIRWTIRHAGTFGVRKQGLRDGAAGLVWSMSELADSHQWETLLSLTEPLSAAGRMPASTAAELAALHLKLAADGFTEAAAPDLVRRTCDGLRAEVPGVSTASALLLAHHRFADASYLDAGLHHARTMLQGWLGPDRDRPAAASLLTGGAGALAVGVRYAALVSDERMLQQCLEIGAAAAAAHPLLVGIDNGLSGLGLALLDCRDVSGDTSYDPLVAEVARKLAEMTVPTVDGPAFPGPTLTRLSNDYATGAAGVLAFFHRLALGTASLTHPILAAVDSVAADPSPVA
ncbi:lipopolysaccharide kinase InaA family protein [Streptomyces sp. NPDC007084]|uniref:protein kinase domain-containing protein n=1 Tax=Streptomyces sp. NPDC007084 TaxID=3154313 RepID=UPI0034525DCE